MQKTFHDILLGISVLPALLVLPALAANPITDQSVFVFGDVAFDNQHVANGEAAFGGRRMNNWVDGKYQNDFPKYQMVGRSFSIADSDVYIGPVTLTLRELTDSDTFVFNYQDEVEGEWTDTDLAANAGVVWNTPLGEEGDTAEDGTVYGLVGGIIGPDNAHYTAPTVWAMSQTNPNAVAGALTFDNVQAVVDGATINADEISVTNNSVLDIVKKNNDAALNTASFFTNPENIDSNGITTLNANTMDFDSSRIIVNAGATLNVNPSVDATFANNEFTGKGGAIYNYGTLTIKNALFTNNSATSNSGAIAQDGTGSVLNLTDVNFTENSADWGGAIVARGNVNIKGGSFIGNTSNDGGGAIYLATLANKGHKLNIDGTTFSENSTAGVDLDGGGAIGSFSDLVLKNATFTGNHVDGDASNGGGAIFMGSVSTNDIYNTTFTGNQSATNGGAISMRFTYQGNNVDATLDIAGGSFNENTATEFGGAIYNTFHNDKNDNKYVSVSNVEFNSNGAMYGGAIYNESADETDPIGGVMNLTDVTFTGNTADELGGAIYSAGVMTFNGAMRFDGNSAGTYGGAIYGDDGYMTFNDAVTFDGNTAAEDGGAVYWYSVNGDVEEAQRTLTFKKAATFTNNSGEGGWGGALHALGSIVKFEDGATFTNNSVFNGGGAIYTDDADLNISGTSNFTNNTADEGGAVYNTEWGRVDISGDATFANNTANEHGGAIYNGIYQDGEEYAGLFTVANATFTGNSANQGGAIYNDNLDDATDFVSMEITDATFNGNTATEEGGAIYNLNGMTFAGTNTFTGNTAGGAANDIYNAGTLTLVDGSTTTIDGGITGNGTLTIASGATFNLGTASVTQGTMVLDGTLNATLQDANNFASFDIADSFGGDGGTLNLVLRGAGEYNVFQGAVFDNANVAVSSGVFDYEWNEDFDTITATMKSTEDIATENGISTEAATTVANLVNSSSDELNDLANAIQDKLASGDADTAAAVEQAHAAIHPETESVVQSVAMHVQNTVANLAAGRLTALTLGRGGGDVDITAGGVWAQGIYNKSKQNDAFRGYTRGVAGGVDMTMNRVLTLGAGYSYAHSDITGTARDTEIDSSTIFAYGQYKPTDWFVNAMANYTMSDYSEHAVALGTNIDANYDVRSYGGQVMTGYDFAGGITPAVGVRYMHISADEYKNSLGIKNKLQDSDYMTAVLETRWTYGFKLNRGLMLKPELRYAVKYDFMSDEQVATILLPGVDSYALDGTRLSRLGAEFGGGLGIRAGGLDLSVNYEIEIREGFTSQTGRARIRYEF